MERTRTKAPEEAESWRIRLQLPSTVELLESADARYAAVLAALTERWWEQLPGLDAQVAQLLIGEAAVIAAEPAIARVDDFAGLLASVRQRRAALAARVLELSSPGSSWAEGLAGLHRRARAQAERPAAHRRPLLAPPRWAGGGTSC